LDFNKSPHGNTLSIGNCASWVERVLNNSNTEVVELTFAALAGEYATGPLRSAVTSPAAVAPPAVLSVSIPPYQAQDVEFGTCTPTPAPNSAAYFRASGPLSFSWRWVTGQRATTCFNSVASNVTC
jgi:hypothetical protein